MKIRITMKDPDGVYDSIQRVVDMALPEGLPENACDGLKRLRRGLAEEAASKWIEYGEYITVEIDTDANTCVVVPAE